jgi:TfoX/Sxy family transcriptional regulator of competence genes
MAYDEGLAQLIRDDLTEVAGITEKKMFGGLCFLLHGHMVAGVHKGGGMFRVGKAAEPQARAIDGAGPMDFTGRPMGGMVNATDDLMVDDARRTVLLGLALTHAKSLPPKG